MAEKTVSTETGAAEGPARTRDEERYIAPPVDIYETPEGLTVIADLPGVAKEDVEVRIDNGVLTIQGRAKAGLPGTPLESEYRLASYFRQFELNDAIDREAITADLKHGALTLKLRKAEKAKPRTIPINAG